MTSLRALTLAALVFAACGRDPLDLPPGDASVTIPVAGTKGGSAGKSATAGASGTGGVSVVPRDAAVPDRKDAAPPAGATVTLLPASATLPIGFASKFSVLAGAGDTKTDVSAKAQWSLSDPSLGSLTSDGTFTGKRAGSATLSAVYDGTTVIAKLTTVVAVPVDVLVNPGQGTANVGSTQKFTALVRYSEGSQSDATELAVWSTRETAIATVSNDAGTRGTATGKSPGNTIVQASVFGATAQGQAQLRVEGASPTTLTVSPAGATRSIGTDVAFGAEARTAGKPEDVTATSTWSSSNAQIASLKANVATCKASGTVTITAVYRGVVASTRLTCATSTGKVVLVLVKPPELTVVSGASYKLTAEATYADRAARDITTEANWTSSDPAVVSVTRGQLTVFKAGTVTITATSADGVSGTSTVTALR